MAITTNQEYLKASLAKFNVTNDDIDLIMLDHPELNSALNPTACKLAIYASLSTILPLTDVSEGGYSVSWDIERLKLWYDSLCKELGKPNVLKPSVRNRSDLW